MACKKHVNIKEICERFNTLRRNSLGQEFSTKEFISLVRTAGITEVIFWVLVKDQVFDKQRRGQNVYYKFKDKPLYIERLSRAYNKYNHKKRTSESPLTEEGAIEFLKERGYKILKESGINQKVLKEKYPEIYESLLIREEV